MMASPGSRREDPPPRPPAPRLSLQRADESLSMRFSNVATPDDEDAFESVPKSTSEDSIELGMDAQELELSEAIIRDQFTTETKTESSREAKAERLLEELRLESDALQSECVDQFDNDDLSPTTVMCITNKLRAAQNQPPLPPPPSVVHKPSPTSEKTSFIHGIKERFKDPLDAFMGKIEEFSDKTGILETKMGKRTDSPESLLSGQVGGSSGSKVSPKTDVETLRQRLIHRNSDQSLLGNTDRRQGSVSPRETLRSEGIAKQRHASFDLANDYHQEPADDSLGVPGVENGSDGRSFPKSCSLDAISGQTTVQKESPKIKNTLKKLIGGRSAANVPKTTPQKRPVAISLSGLLSNQEVEGEDASNSENDQFYDPQIDNKASKSSTTTTNTTPGAAQRPSELSAAPTESPGPPAQPEEPPEDDPPAHPTRLLPSRQRVFSVCVAVIAYLLVPLPTYLAGMVLGGFLATAAIFSYLWWVTPPPAEKRSLRLPDLATLPPLEVPEMRDSKNDPDKFKGWMNELKHYNEEEYHISQTQSVFVALEGTKLRLQTPKQNIPRRAMWDEPQPFKAVFIRQRHYDIEGTTLTLVPNGLVAKRLWSKKYPICLEIPSDSMSPSKDLKNKRNTIKVYLFARSARDKEDWYRRFEAASQGKPLPTRIADIIAKSEFRSHHRRMSSSSSLETFVHRRSGSTDSNISDVERDFVMVAQCDPSHERRLRDFLRYMARAIPSESQQRLQAAALQGQRKPGSILLPSPANCEPQVAWVNALVSRCFWDFLREKFWVDKIKEKIQKKLGKIHIPYFIDELTVTGIELGSEMPVIRRASPPYVDDRGLWIDLDVAYTGGFRMSLATKCNLMKLTKGAANLEERDKKESPAKSAKSPIHDSAEEDSAESSTDEEAEEAGEVDKGAQGGGASRKILRLVDKLSQSKYFQKAAEYKYIKRAMEGVSNTRLLLVVELKNIAGPLAINIPNPPTDRLWYGFRKNPRLWLSAKPWVGEREVSLSHVTDWLEKKLAVEFQRVFVMPNMDDLLIPVMCDHLGQSQTSQNEQPPTPRKETPPPPQPASNESVIGDVAC